MKTKHVADHIINWLNTYVEKSNLDGFVIGVSGGVDSALTSTLCANTGKPTLCLEMPIHQESNQEILAQQHYQTLSQIYGYPLKNNFSKILTRTKPLMLKRSLLVWSLGYSSSS